MNLPIYRIAKGINNPLTEDKAKTLLGGKGAALVKMTKMGLEVPPAFTITTKVCNDFLALGDDAKSRNNFIHNMMNEVMIHYEWLTGYMGYAPLVSVRSGAPVSMPGMMDTILNVGITPENADEWSQRLGERGAVDSLRRLVQMMGSTAFGINMLQFDKALAKIKASAKVSDDKDLTVQHLEELVLAYQDIFLSIVKHDFPATVEEQLRAAILAVFNSWNNPRAIQYREINNIDSSMGTAVTIQTMVFGNLNDQSGSGVAFTRNPSTGEEMFFCEFLPNAQGEDVVAGIRTPYTLFELMEGDNEPELWAKIYEELLVVSAVLEKDYRDMVDLEFTVQDKKLYILQSRVGKRSARAAFKIGIDLLAEGIIEETSTLFERLTVDQFKKVRRPTIDPSFDVKPSATGLAACPGVVRGIAVFSSDDAINCNEPCILVTEETDPDDIGGMNAAVGILTATGGATSHAAVVARAMDKPCVVGCTGLDIEALKTASQQPTHVTIDGSTGKVWFNVDVPVMDGSSDASVLKFMELALEHLDAKSNRLDNTIDGQYLNIEPFLHNWPKAEAFLDRLAASEFLERCVISLKPLRPPEMHKNEVLLADCFMVGDDFNLVDCSPARFLHEVKERKLGHLIVFKDVPAELSSEHTKGLQVAGPPKTVFDMLTYKYPEITPEFIEDVLGGVEVYEMLKGKIKGKPYIIPKTMAPEYAVFTVLGK